MRTRALIGQYHIPFWGSRRSCRSGLRRGAGYGRCYWWPAIHHKIQARIHGASNKPGRHAKLNITRSRMPLRPSSHFAIICSCIFSFSLFSLHHDQVRLVPPQTDIPSLAGRVILVTGGNAGLGKAAAQELARHGPAQVWLACRDAGEGRAAAAEIASDPDVVTNNPRTEIRALVLDLASLSSV